MKTQGALLIATLVATTSVSAQLNFFQWPTASGGNDHFYAVTPNAANWSTAEAFAVSQGGHLASITSAGEQSFLTTTFLNGFFDSRSLWIGLTDRTTEGVFLWTTGEPFSYTRWYAGEPNDGGGLQTPEDYVAMNWQRAAGQTSTKGEWNDTPLNGTVGLGGLSSGPYYGIIEVVPEPSAFLLGGVGMVGLLVWRRFVKAA